MMIVNGIARGVRWALVVMHLIAVPAITCAAEVRSVPVPRTTVYPGEPVVDSNLISKRFRFANGTLAAYVTETVQISGRLARRTLVAGRPIALSGLRNEEVVKQGRPTVAFYESSGLVITAQVQPLQSGEAGQRIQVRNVDSGRLVMATVRADGSLLIEDPQ